MVLVCIVYYIVVSVVKSSSKSTFRKLYLLLYFFFLVKTFLFYYEDRRELQRVIEEISEGDSVWVLYYLVPLLTAVICVYRIAYLPIKKPIDTSK